MKCSRWVVGLLAAVLAGGAVAGKVERQQKKRAAADSLFDQSEYLQALEAYRPYAEDGDKFAQYRIGLIHYFGLGTGQRDRLTAYLWLTVAQEPELGLLRGFSTVVGEELTQEESRQARWKLPELDAQFGTVVKRKKDKRSRGECTGSRVGFSCERVKTIGTNMDSDFYQVNSGPFTMRMEEVQSFKALYDDLIDREFARFDSESNGN